MREGEGRQWKEGEEKRDEWKTDRGPKIRKCRRTVDEGGVKVWKDITSKRK